MLKFSVDLQSFKKKFGRVPSVVFRTEGTALVFVKSYIFKEIEKFVDSDGSGDWKERSEFGNLYTSWKKKNAATFRRKSKEDSGMSFLLKYLRFRIFNDFPNRNLYIDFRKSTDKKINYIIPKVQTGDDIPVTDLMRKAFSYTSKPLEKKTTHINIPAREIGKPVFQKTKQNYFSIFSDNFLSGFFRELENGTS